MIPVGFVAGALSARGRTEALLQRLPARRVTAFVVLATLMLIVASASTMRTYSGDGFVADEGVSALPPPATDVIGEGWINQGSSIGLGSINAVTLEPEPETLLDSWRDLRLEAWPAMDPMTLETAPVADHREHHRADGPRSFGGFTGTLGLGIAKEPRWFVIATTGEPRTAPAISSPDPTGRSPRSPLLARSGST